MVRNKHLILILGAASLFISWALQAQATDVLLLNRAALEEARVSLQSGQQNPPAHVKELLKNAEKALKADLVSVMMKQQTPPSGDKHDYMSLAPYWWPDSSKPGGLPYVRRDGERNPELLSYGDHERIGSMIGHVETLALAFGVSGKEACADKAVDQLKAWFLDPATRMNPNLNFGQAIKGVNDGRGIGIIETYGFRNLIDAMILLKSSKAWTPEIDRGIKAWFGEYLRWLQESPNGKDEAGWKNNHGSAYDVQATCIALFLGKESLAKQILSQVGTKRIAVQVEPDGSQPLELERTKSWGYSIMNLNALLELARLGDRVGVDLWHFQTSDGRSLRRSIDYLLPYAIGKKKWPLVQIEPFRPEGLYYALRIAADQYGDKTYSSAAQLLVNDEVRASRLTYSLPPVREQ